MPHDKAALPTTSLTCDLGIQHTSCTTLAAEDRKALLKQVKAGEVTEVEFDAIVFAAVYPNSNFLRFYDKDLSALAASFGGQPFLRNHDVGDIGSRDGTILRAHLVGPGTLLVDARAPSYTQMRPGAPLVITFSNRCFPTKAIALWHHLDDEGHVALVAQWLRDSGAFADVTTLARRPRGRGSAQPEPRPPRVMRLFRT